MFLSTYLQTSESNAKITNELKMQVKYEMIFEYIFRVLTQYVLNRIRNAARTLLTLDAKNPRREQVVFDPSLVHFHSI